MTSGQNGGPNRGQNERTIRALPIPVNEANETTALIHELMEVVAKEAKRVFVSSAEDLVQQHYCSRVGQTLELAVKDAESTDLEWLQEELRERASTEIDYLRCFIESLIEERDEARAEVERLRALYVEARADGFRDGRRSGAEDKR